MGRMQLMGFGVVGVLFFNFGGDGTTFLIPSEVFATPVRARAHGMSAFSGKVGAFVGTYGVGALLDATSLPILFYFLGAVALGGGVFTYFLIPESGDIDIQAEDVKFVEKWLGKEKAAKWFSSKRNVDALEFDVPEMDALSLRDAVPEVEVTPK